MVAQLDENTRMIETQKMEINGLREQLRKYVILPFTSQYYINVCRLGADDSKMFVEPSPKLQVPQDHAALKGSDDLFSRAQVHLGLFPNACTDTKDHTSTMSKFG